MPIDPLIPLSVVQPNIPTPQAMQASAAKMQEDKLKQQQAQEQQAASVALRGALNSSLDKDGNINRETFTAMIKNTPAIDKLPDFLTYFDKVDEARAKARSESISAKQAQNDHIAAIATTAEDYLNKGLPLPIATHALLAGVAQAVNDGIITEQEASQRLAGMDPEDPNSVKQMIAGMKASAAKAPKPGTPYTLNPGDVRYDENNQPVASVPAKAPTSDLPASAKEYEYYVKQETDAGRKPLSFDEYQTRDANRHRPITNVNAGGLSADGGIGTLTPAGVELAAARYRLTGSLPARDSKQNGAIISQAAAQAKILGNTPVATIQKQAAYKADSAALSNMTKMSAAAEAFENKALEQSKIVRDLSKKVPRTQFPFINAAILAGKKEILGDSNTQQLFNALTTFTAEYAKIMEGSTGAVAASSDAARKAANSLVAAKLSDGTLNDTLTLMEKEMRYSVQGYDATIQHITERMGGTAPAGATPTPAPSAPTGGAGLSYQDYLKSRK